MITLAKPRPALGAAGNSLHGRRIFDTRQVHAQAADDHGRYRRGIQPIHEVGQRGEERCRDALSHLQPADAGPSVREPLARPSRGWGWLQRDDLRPSAPIVGEVCASLIRILPASGSLRLPPGVQGLLSRPTAHQPVSVQPVKLGVSLGVPRIGSEITASSSIAYTRCRAQPMEIYIYLSM